MISEAQVNGVPMPGSGTVYFPVELRFPDFLFHNALCERATADVAEANH